MHITLDINLILNLLTVAGIGWMLKSLIRMDATLGKLKVWMEAHTKSDDERHREVIKNIDGLWDIQNQRERERR